MASKDEEFFNETSDDLEPETLEMEAKVEKESKKKKVNKVRYEEVTDEIKRITVGWAVAVAAITFLVGFISGGMIMKMQASPALPPGFDQTQLGSAPALTGDQAESGQLPSGHVPVPESGAPSGAAAGALDPNVDQSQLPPDHAPVPGADSPSGAADGTVDDPNAGGQEETGDVPKP